MVFLEIIQAGIFIEIPDRSVDTALKRISALLEGGIRLIGIDIRHSEGLRIVEESASRFADRLIIKADFVLDSDSARKAILAGADIVSTPYLIKDVLTICNRYGKICIPGALTATEVLKALEWGAHLVKLYPADLFGPGLLKAIKSPLPQASLIPSAGVNLDNMAAWFRAGASAVVIDGTCEKADEDDFMHFEEKITMHARQITKCFKDTTTSMPSQH
jgi:2-dehydro-3-deoxyphosphogluconate aldolase/(4S)-4-hydroxy-2-oxoglutarate aldolase